MALSEAVYLSGYLKGPPSIEGGKAFKKEIKLMNY